MGKTKDRKKAEKKADRKAAKREKKHRVIEAVARTAGYVTGAVTPAGALRDEKPVLTPTADLFAAISTRRSHKRFLPKPVERDTLAVMLDMAVLAPNHKMTQPWGFIVFNEAAKRSYGEAKALLKLNDPTDAAGAEKAAKMVDEALGIPALVAVTQKLADDPVRREEDYAAVFMAIQNMLLSATAFGLGTKLHTGAILDDMTLRNALGVADEERVVAIIDVGEPAEVMPAKRRAPASEKTRWLE